MSSGAAIMEFSDISGYLTQPMDLEEFNYQKKLKNKHQTESNIDNMSSEPTSKMRIHTKLGLTTPTYKTIFVPKQWTQTTKTPNHPFPIRTRIALAAFVEEIINEIIENAKENSERKTIFMEDVIKAIGQSNWKTLWKQERFFFGNRFIPSLNFRQQLELDLKLKYGVTKKTKKKQKQKQKTKDLPTSNKQPTRKPNKTTKDGKGRQRVVRKKDSC
jgi:hypothetical protein